VDGLTVEFDLRPGQKIRYSSINHLLKNKRCADKSELKNRKVRVEKMKSAAEKSELKNPKSSAKKSELKKRKVPPKTPS